MQAPCRSLPPLHQPSRAGLPLAPAQPVGGFRLRRDYVLLRRMIFRVATYPAAPASHNRAMDQTRPPEQRPFITHAQAQSAMNAMLKQAMRQPNRAVAMAIVDDAGLLIAYQQMDRLRLFTRRHAIRKAYTAAITGMNSGAFGEDCVKSRGHTVREIGGDLELTPGHGGVVVRSK